MKSRTTLLWLSLAAVTATTCIGAVPGAAATVTLKPPMTGVLDRGGEPVKSYQPMLNGYVVNVGWDVLQPAAGGPIAPNNPIDAAITAVRARNAQTPGLDMSIKIRLFAGAQTPAWLKAAEGTVEVKDPSSQRSYQTIGKFWTAGYGRAYADLENELAAKYDAVAEVRDVVTSRCMTVYAETFLRNALDIGTVKNLVRAGFTWQSDHVCLQEEIAAQAVWATTRSSVAFNPYQQVNPDGGVRVDETFTEQMLVYCRQVLGLRCVLENNSVRYPPITGDYSRMYAKMKALGAPITFQTATLARIGDLAKTLRWAVANGADAVEVPQGYAGLCSRIAQYCEANLAPYDTSLSGNWTS